MPPGAAGRSRGTSTAPTGAPRQHRHQQSGNGVVTYDAPQDIPCVSHVVPPSHTASSLRHGDAAISKAPGQPLQQCRKAVEAVIPRAERVHLRASAGIQQLLEDGVWPKYLCGLAVVVFQEPTEPLSALDWPFTIIGRLPGTKRNHIAESLMTPFLVVMLNVLAQHMTQ